MTNGAATISRIDHTPPRKLEGFGLTFYRNGAAAFGLSATFDLTEGRGGQEDYLSGLGGKVYNEGYAIGIAPSSASYPIQVRSDAGETELSLHLYHNKDGTLRDLLGSGSSIIPPDEFTIGSIVGFCIALLLAILALALSQPWVLLAAAIVAVFVYRTASRRSRAIADLRSMAEGPQPEVQYGDEIRPNPDIDDGQLIHSVKQEILTWKYTAYPVRVYAAEADKYASNILAHRAWWFDVPSFDDQVKNYHITLLPDYYYEAYPSDLAADTMTIILSSRALFSAIQKAGDFCAILNSDAHVGGKRSIDDLVAAAERLASRYDVDVPRFARAPAYSGPGQFIREVRKALEDTASFRADSEAALSEVVRAAETLKRFNGPATLAKYDGAYSDWQTVVSRREI